MVHMRMSLENDMVCLIESLNLLNDDKNSQIQALEHLADMCLQEHGDVVFHKVNGLSTVLKLAFNNDKKTPSVIVQKSLITLGNAVLQSDSNKMILSSDQILTHISSKLLVEEQDTRMIASAAYFLSCLCSSNEKVQNKMRKSKCLEKLIKLYRYYHPKGNSGESPVEEWFDKAASNSPVILNHISHALKAMINKPKNRENQIACSRLLNLALCTLQASSWNIESKIESLQFIADCVYENENSINIFNMIGGVRLLSDILKKETERSDLRVDFLNAVIDTFNVIASDGGVKKNISTGIDVICVLLSCLKKDELRSLHLKCLICLSEVVHDNEKLQAKFVASNGIADVITFMSLNQDEIVSKVGTSILQNCVKTWEDFEDFGKQSKNEEKEMMTIKTVKTKSTDENSPDSRFENMLKNAGVNDPEALKKILFHVFEEKIKKSYTKGQKTGKLYNLRGKRIFDEEYSSKTQELQNSREKPEIKLQKEQQQQKQQSEKMMDMLKEQQNLLRNFQHEIFCLRAEVRSQTSEFDGSTAGLPNDFRRNNNNINKERGNDINKKNYARSLTSPARSMQLEGNGMKNPYRRLYTNLCPGTEPRKRTQILNMQLFTPQPECRRRDLLKIYQRGTANTDELPDKNMIEVNLSQPYEESTSESKDSLGLDDKCVNANDEKPALEENFEHSIGRRNSKRRILPTEKLPSVYEKVKEWQEQSMNFSPNKDIDGFQVPSFTPFTSKSSKPIRSTPYSGLSHESNRYQAHVDNRTPYLEIRKKTAIRMQDLQNAPKKVEQNKRRRPLTPTENEKIQSLESATIREQDIHKTLVFERSEDDFQDGNVKENQTQKNFEHNLHSRHVTSTRNLDCEVTTIASTLPKQTKQASDKYSTSSAFYELSSKRSGAEYVNGTRVLLQHLLRLKSQTNYRKSIKCLACRPVMGKVNSHNIFTVLQEDPNTCEYHQKLGESLKEYSTVIRQCLLSDSEKTRRSGEVNNENGDRTCYTERLARVNENGNDVVNSIENCGESRYEEKRSRSWRKERRLVENIETDRLDNRPRKARFIHDGTKINHTRNNGNSINKHNIHKVNNHNERKILNNKKRKYLTPKNWKIDGNKNAKKRLNYSNRELECMSVFSFRSGSNDDSISLYSTNTRCTTKTFVSATTRRQRKEYTEDEVDYILKGIERYGKRWNLILNAFPFKAGRQPIDLMDKYKRLKKSLVSLKTNKNNLKVIPVPFTSQELVNLKRDTTGHGEHCNGMLKYYQFNSSRTTVGLQGDGN